MVFDAQSPFLNQQAESLGVRTWPAACGCHVGGASCALPAGPGAAPPKEKGRAAKDALLLLLALGLKPVLLPKGAPASGGGAELEKGAG